jgi:hypothetical protein
VEDEGGSIGNFVSQCRKNQSLVEITAWYSRDVPVLTLALRSRRDEWYTVQ